jgi:hypothetical protein
MKASKFKAQTSLKPIFKIRDLASESHADLMIRGNRDFFFDGSFSNF